MRIKSLAEMPESHKCKQCGETKPVAEIVVVRIKGIGYEVRPWCKPCHNEKQRGQNREWRRDYQRRWREKNPDLNQSYRQTDDYKEKNRKRSTVRHREHRDVLRIQSRLRKSGEPVAIAEARELLAKYGPLYPTEHGLTEEGKKEVQRIRDRLYKRRRRGVRRRLTVCQIRKLVYEEGYFIKPERQLLKPVNRKTMTAEDRTRLSTYHQKEGTNDVTRHRTAA